MSASLSPYRSTSFDKIFAAIKQLHLVNFIIFTFLLLDGNTRATFDGLRSEKIINLIQPITTCKITNNRCRLQRELDQNKFEFLPDLNECLLFPIKMREFMPVKCLKFSSGIQLLYV